MFVTACTRSLTMLEFLGGARSMVSKLLPLLLTCALLPVSLPVSADGAETFDGWILSSSAAPLTTSGEGAMMFDG